MQAIEALLGGHSFFSLDSGRAAGHAQATLGFADFAVLYRTEAQAEPLCAALARAGLPFQCRSHAPLTHHAGVQALRPWLAQAAGQGGSVLAQLQWAVAQASAAGVLDAALGRETLALLRPLALAAGSDAAHFAAELALASGVDAWDPRAEGITLLTLHAAKGLEFAVVFLVGCEDGLLPLRWGAVDAEALAEERRLFYVGMRRARFRLFLSYARRRRWQGKWQARQPSPFLQAIAEELLERPARSPKPRPAAAAQLRLW
ncbi:MAG: hypothetical protein KatS3mg131_3426 [Candidatus Tectimicrobiota bacterium]|nr:MAG: hypothetical protein KatS3mg131_3426 [Candidatus Tectomicrobia bacterium]